jgi:hypothetical protein
VKLHAILGGGDWTDASVDHLLIPDGMDLEAEKVAWRKWYDETYLPGMRGAMLPRVPYQEWVEWLLERGAVRAGPEHITVLWG